MKKESLYIIGNGFDKHHYIKSGFSDFKNYILNIDHSLYNLIKEYIPVVEDSLKPNKDWENLERALAETDSESIVDYASQFFESYDSEDWSDSYHHDPQYEIERIVEGLSTKLKTRFAEWVTQLYIPKHTEVENQIISIDINAKFLSFNYTSTLSLLYGIPRDKILFIHGEAGHSKQEIVLGHAWKPISAPKDNFLNSEDMDPRILEVNRIINRYFKSTFKDVESIIIANKSFFKSLYNITNIYVLGHSLSDIDLDYYKEIIKNIDINKVQWKISFYGNNDLSNHKATIKKLGLIGNNVTFFELNVFRVMG